MDLLIELALVDADENSSYQWIRGMCEFLWDESVIFHLLDEYRAREDNASRKLIARITKRILSYQTSPSILDLVIELACADALNSESPLADAISSLVEPWMLDDPNIQDIRFGQIKPQITLAPPPAQRVENALIAFEAGKRDAWMALWQELNLADDTDGYRWWGAQIVDMPGWARLDAKGKLRVCRCALAWLDSQLLTDSDLYLGNQYSYVHVATFLALALLFREDRNALRQFPISRWEGWAPVILRYRFGGYSEIREALLLFAHAQAPGAVLRALRREMENELSNKEPITLGYELNLCWNEETNAALHELLARDHLEPLHRETILGYLLAHGDEVAGDESLCRLNKASGEEALRYAALLLEHLTPEFWIVLWEKMLADECFGRDFMLASAYHEHPFPFLDSLDEPQLAQLYVWLEIQFPQAEDILHPEGVITLTSRDDVARLRENCVTHLTNRGTAAAINELSELAKRFPTYDWLWHNLAQAREKARELAWQAVPPRELLEFVQRGDGRLVRNADEFAEAVMASLDRLQVRLQGEHPLAPFLWNLDEDEKHGRPKSEDRMSDFVLHHLRDDLPTLLVNREVQVQNLNETGIGQRADLKLETLDGAGNRLTLIIESKGCWNADIPASMKTQLYERYMRQTGAVAGIYLVGWFESARWVDCPKKTVCRRHVSLDRLQAELASQAKNLPGVKVCVLNTGY